MGATTSSPLLAALDSGSPLTSVALARGKETLAVRSERGRLASERVLAMLDAACREVGITPRELDGLIALRGPGSFTGLRVGLATALGIHQALGLRVAALPTLHVLASSIPSASGPVVAAVDALRGEWTVQTFDVGGGWPRALDEPHLVPARELTRTATGILVGFGVESLVGENAGATVEIRQAPPLAPVAAAMAARREPAWDADLLTRPLYARPPAVHEA